MAGRRGHLASVSELLRSGQIRSHLKLLTVELIAAHPQTRDDELTVLIPWIDSEMNCRRTGQPNPDKLASRIWESFFSRHANCSLWLIELVSSNDGCILGSRGWRI